LEKLSWAVIKDDTWHKEYSALKKELKQAEFLIHQHLPVAGILGIVTQNEEIATFVRNEISLAKLSLQVVVKPEYYYS
jgi:ssDNA thymidine ADP-ribosyltransferase, DarT